MPSLVRVRAVGFVTNHCLLLPRGGIPPKARRRSRLALTPAEREDISRGIASGSSIREIARHLDRAASTVGGEVTRHGGRPTYRAHEAQGIEFVSFSEQLDTSTPAAKMVFTILGAAAELERGLIVERVKAGLRNAKAKGKQLGRPKKILDTKRIAALRATGVG